MKKLFRTMIAVAVAAAAMTSCAKEMQEIVQENGVPFQVTMQGPDTKAIFGTAESSKYPVLWQEGDEVKVMALKTPGSKTDVAVVEGKKYTVTVANEGKSASFTAECPAAATAPYQFFVLSPNSAFVSCGDDATNKDYIQYTVPASQTPTATSVDPAAIITLGVSTQSADIPGAINLTFKHLTAYGLLTLNNLTTGGKAVKSISLTFDESLGISGRWMYHPSTDATNVNNKGNVITVNTDKTENVYFSCAPVDISGTKITVTVAVEGSNLIKEITVPADKAFKAGTVSKFAIDMTGATEEAAKVFAPVAVSDLSTLKAGDQLIIASVGAIGDMGRVACSTTQATSNRTGISVGTLINEEGKLVNPTSGVQIVTLKEGTIEGCFLLEVGEGQYLYCPGVTKKNQLKTTTDLVTDNDAANWKIYADGEKTRIASQVKSDWAGDAKPNRIYIEFNKDDGKCSSYPIDSQSAACLFRLEGSTPPTPKVLTVERLWGKVPGEWPQLISYNANEDRCVAMDEDYVYVAKAAAGTAGIRAISVTDPTVIKDVNVTGIEGGHFPTSCVRTVFSTTLGKHILLASSMAMSNGQTLKIYAWKDGIESAPTVLLSWAIGDDRRFGDFFTVFGTFEDGEIYFRNNTQTTDAKCNLTAQFVLKDGALTAQWPNAFFNGYGGSKGMGSIYLYKKGGSKWYLVTDAIGMFFPAGEQAGEEWGNGDDYSVWAKLFGIEPFEFNGEKYIAYHKMYNAARGWLTVAKDVNGTDAGFKESMIKTKESTNIIFQGAVQINVDGPSTDVVSNPTYSGNTMGNCDVVVKEDAAYIVSHQQNTGIAVFKMYMK